MSGALFSRLSLTTSCSEYVPGRSAENVGLTMCGLGTVGGAAERFRVESQRYVSSAPSGSIDALPSICTRLCEWHDSIRAGIGDGRTVSAYFYEIGRAVHRPVVYDERDDVYAGTSATMSELSRMDSRVQRCCPTDER